LTTIPPYELFESQHESLKREFANIAAVFAIGAEVHRTIRPSQAATEALV
jgi:hypothetical protein